MKVSSGLDRIEHMFDDLQVPYDGEDPDDGWTPDPAEQAEATGFITELEEAERSVDRLDADGTLSEAEALRAAVVDEREAERRRTRPKTRGQKLRMIESKKHRAKHKAKRGRVRDW